jgi:DNA-binding protein HU-beta
MNRKDLIDAMAGKTGLSKKDTDSCLGAFLDTVVDELKRGGQVSLVGFGTFKTVQRAARQARNPQTGATVHVPARKVPVFKVGKGLKSAF